MDFILHAPFKPTGDQPEAIDKLVNGIHSNLKHQVLLGVTGSGKTFTLASVIAKVQKPTLIISHNKTLAAQLYQEFREFFSQNAVCYFVSYYDYYQPEAYIPQTDTYIEKETEINEEIDKLRLSATANLLTRRDTIIISSVSCIYNIGSPISYANFVLDLRIGLVISQNVIAKRMTDLQYERATYGFHRGTFRVIGDTIDIYLAYEDQAIRVELLADKVKKITKIDPLNGNKIVNINRFTVYPAKHYLTKAINQNEIFIEIRADLQKRITELKKQGKLLEAHRLSQKVNFDLEMIEEVGYVNGIENYSRYFDGRSPGDPPYTLLDYFKEPYKDDWLIIIDESHMTIPQIRGMYNGDKARKQTLVDYGFRLPAALDNRPLTFLEFETRNPQTIYMSATPNDWELSLAREDNGIAEQLVRPTAITDPQISIKPSKGQIIDLIYEIIKRKKRGERVLVTTLTKKMAEDLSAFLTEKKFRSLPGLEKLSDSDCPLTHYLHSDIKTLERSDILDNLRLGKYDVLVGINLLREGLDLPEVSLVAILDADKEGFLRSQTSLIQTMGRAARHIRGKVIMYADSVTGSMKRAIAEIDRRRKYQLNYNTRHHLNPGKITKPIRKKLVTELEEESLILTLSQKKRIEYRELLKISLDALTPLDHKKYINRLTKEMKLAASELNFELAAEIRDKIKELKKTK